ncbi:MAG: DNA-directed RNA polymerase subunit beta' [Ruminococcaceae bacterium]|nr:DNA-directed RNA polymerase subunit beta' [Oscillospiraceae bacterium]
MVENEHIEFESIQIGLASPEKIREWSYGEVKKPETINYRSLKPEKDGLFCERIFGPQKDWECSCGKYKRIHEKGQVCEKCGVEITTNKVRRERMGHVELAAPVSHFWYFRAIPSRLGLMLDLSPKNLEKVLYFANYIVLDPGPVDSLKKKQILTESQYKEYYERYEDDFRVGIGAEAIKELLQEIDLEELSAYLKNELITAQGQRKAKFVKRLEVVESFRTSGNKPEWMILDVLPVIPPEIRPMVQLDGGRFATSDLNDLYRRVINRNNRLRKLMDLKAPSIIIRNEKRMLQEAVDSLIDNGKRSRAVIGANTRPLKSLSEMLRGKQGRFRQNLLGKRVDYSGRSVIVVGPELKIYQCGLPKEMALELFKPFVMKTLVASGIAKNIKDAKKRVERATDEVWDALEGVIKEHPVLLNRAPTLHRLSIQAFEPILVEGRAIKLHPLVCTAFNADFDGDQMPVHVPLSVEAQAEARFLMLSANNLLKPVNGKAVTIPSQDMVLGSFYLTMEKDGEIGEGSIFKDYEEAQMAYQNGDLGLHAKISVRMTREVRGEQKTGIVHSTLGRLIFNSYIPQDLGFVDRTDPENDFVPEIDFVTTSSELGEIVDRCIRVHGTAKTCEVLDMMKAMGFKYSTRAAITISIYDMTIPPEKQALIAESEQKVDKINEFFRKGYLSEDERSKRVVDEWSACTNRVTDALKRNLDKYNPLNLMSTSGARGSIKQIRQLAGMRGLMFAATGKTIEMPIKANFREGMKVLEYFIAARGARKGLADTALRTADSGYLTRRLVDVSQEVIVREHDCHDKRGLIVRKIVDVTDGGKEAVIEPFINRLVGRYVIGDVVHPETGEVIVADNMLIKESDAAAIVAAGIEEVRIRSVINCKAQRGICVHCYGADLATGLPVSIGESVGIIAAQSIGEPGTQLTMRTFHTGGVAGSDITQGLPRVEEIFEARRPKKAAELADRDGIVRIEDGKRNKQITIVNDEDGTASSPIAIPGAARILVKEGDRVTKCQKLTEGTETPADILRISGLDAVYEYIIKEIQRVYGLQGVEINDKHIEVIARQMTKKVKIESAGDTELLVGSSVDCAEVLAANEEIQRKNQSGETEVPLLEATYSPMLLGITKASLSTESFLSAASFQETTKVLTEAAIKGKRDHLVGLKENVIIGKLIPAGTGMKHYNRVDIVSNEEEEIGAYDLRYGQPS